MDPHSSSPRRPSAARPGPITAGLLLVLLAALFSVQGAPPHAEDRPAPPFTPDRKAKNPERIVLLPHPPGVVGWISGREDHTGDTVTVSDGDREMKVTVGAGGFFDYRVRVDEPRALTFRLGERSFEITLRPQEKLPPSVFFVLDRSVYRPRQVLHFAGFVRQVNAGGDFVPLCCPVELVLTSVARKTVVARLKRSADAQGRITGEYTFTRSDPLGEYTLSAPGFGGQAELSLAEYRTTPLRLSMDRQRQGTELTLRFRARDYLGQPVPGGTVQLTAQVIRAPARPPQPPLDGKQFVHAGNGPPALRLEDLGIEEGLLIQTESEQGPVLGLKDEPQKVVKEIKGETRINRRGEGLYVLSLPHEWLDQRHLLAVQAVLLDATGREVRKTETLPIQDEEKGLQLSLAQTHVFAGEPIRLRLHGKDGGKLMGQAMLAVMKLSARLPEVGPGLVGPGDGMMGMRGMSPSLAGPMKMPDRDDWLRRSLVSVEPFAGETARLRIEEPGAYILVALVVQPDGTRLRQEVGCVVQSLRERPALVLRLERDTWTAGDTLRGTLTSRYANACVLFLVRDSRGIQLRWSQTLENGSCKIEQKLPADLRYGACVEAQYCDSLEGPTHVVSRLIHVLPGSRLLVIRSKVRPVVEPGEKVSVDLEVDRQDPVDLVVSVYDEALLAIAPDQARDIVPFFLADERVREHQGGDVLRRCLGNVTFGQLLRLARRQAGLTDRDSETVRSLARGLAKNRRLTTYELAALLRAAGHRLRCAGSNTHVWSVPPGRPLEEIKVVEVSSDDWKLVAALVYDTFLLGEYHPTEHPDPWQPPSVSDGIYSGWPLWNMMGTPGMAGMAMMGGGMMGMRGLGALGGALGGIQGGLGGGFNQLGAGGMRGSGGLPLQGGLAPVPGFVAHQPAAPAILADTPEGPPVPVRRDFSDSAFWNATVRTDAAGKARVEFRLPDSLTTWRVVVTGVSREMHVGQHTTSFRSAKELMVHPLVPRFFVEGDRTTVAARVQNHADARRVVRVGLKADGLAIQGDREKEVPLGPRERATVSWPVEAGKAGDARLEITARAAKGSDAALKRVPIVHAGAERLVTASAFCKKPLEFTLPAGIDPKTVQLEARFLPALTADLVDTLDYLVDYPYGCVEQTMSRFLPAIKVAQLLERLHLDHPGLQKKLPGCVQEGISRLLHFQHADGGWGWYENDPTHEIMTPYALYGLIEAERAGYPLPIPEAIPRGLDRLRASIEQGNSRPANRVYCMYVYGQRKPLPPSGWELLESWLGRDDLSDYALALALELAVQQKKPVLAQRLADRLHDRARRSGDRIHWETAGLSHWADDPFEVTAAVLKALVARDREDRLIPGTIQYFLASKRGTHWNSTKDTAMIVYALCDYLARQDAGPGEQHALRFRCNDAPAQEVAFARLTEPQTISIPAEQIHAGVNRLTFQEPRPQVMARIVLRYWQEGRSLGPDSHGLRVERVTWLLDAQGKRVRQLKSGDSVRRGSYLQSVVTVEPEDAMQVLQYAVVENRKPAGCEVVPVGDRRFPLKDSGCLLREDRDQLVAFHHLEAGLSLTDSCVLLTETAGDYLVPAARAELMYQTEIHGHSGTFVLHVVEK